MELRGSRIQTADSSTAGFASATRRGELLHAARPPRWRAHPYEHRGGQIQTAASSTTGRRRRRRESKDASMALPVAKLGTLALQTLSKPIASRLKSQATVHPKFRNFIIGIAQFS